MRRRYWVAIALCAVAVILSGWYASRRLAPVVEQIYPLVVRPGEQVYLRVKNLPIQIRPKVFFAGNPLEVTDVRDLLSGRSLVAVRVPGVIGAAPLVITKGGPAAPSMCARYFTQATSKQILKITRSDTLAYPKDTTYLLRNPVSYLQVTPFGAQKVLVVAGYPTDVAPRFTAGDFDADVQNRYSAVSSYFSTVSKNNVTLSADLYPQLIKLTKKYGEYVHESRYPVARGAAIPYPIDLSTYTDHNLSIDVTGPDGVVHTSTATLDSLPASALSSVQWYNAWQIFMNANGMLPVFIDDGAGKVSMDIILTGANLGSSNPEYFLGDGYRITALNGAAWAAFGLSPGQVQLTDGAGLPPGDARYGMDVDSATGWVSELEAALDASGMDLSGYASINYMLIGTPVVGGTLDFLNLNTIGYLESHGLRSSAYRGYGWMRLPHNVDWKTWAHETGHNLSLSDAYQENLSQPGAFMNGWTLMAYHFYASHITGWEKGPRIGQSTTGGSWLPTGTIVQATPPGPSGGITTTTAILAPHYDALPAFPGYADPVGYGAEIKLSPSHSIMLEGRQDQPVTSPRRFDEELDQIDTAPGNGGVLVYDVRNVSSYADWPNVYRRELILLSPYADALDTANPLYADPATGVTVRVLEELGTGSNRSFRVGIDWGRANPPEGTRFDAYVTPWDSTYQSPDIWVDSPLNGYDTYESTAYTADGDPDGAGDTVAVGEENRLYARIRNLGPEAIPSATVTFWAATPAGIGDRGDWQRLDPVTIGPIPAGGSVKAYTIWIPKGTGHTCVKVEVTPLDGEISFANNMAQENFTNFEMTSSSPYGPLKFTFDVFNSSKEKRQYALRAHRRIPWIEVNLDHAYPVIPAGGKVTVNGVLKLNEKVEPGPKNDTPLAISAYAPRHDSEIDLGGIALNLLPRRRSSIDVTVDGKPGEPAASGTVKGGSFPRLVTLVVHNVEPNGKRTYVQSRTDEKGRFLTKIPVKGKQAVDVYVYAPAAAEFSSARSKVVRVQ